MIVVPKAPSFCTIQKGVRDGISNVETIWKQMGNCNNRLRSWEALLAVLNSFLTCRTFPRETILVYRNFFLSAALSQSEWRKNER